LQSVRQHGLNHTSALLAAIQLIGGGAVPFSVAGTADKFTRCRPMLQGFDNLIIKGHSMCWDGGGFLQNPFYKLCTLN
jgi:hypothetical protein